MANNREQRLRPVDADTISDQQIRELRDLIYARAVRGAETKEDREIHAMCESALNEMCHPQRRREARRLLAELFERGWSPAVAPPQHVGGDWSPAQHVRSAS